MWELWLDLETTGLDPETGKILEVGAILVTPERAVAGQLMMVCAYPHEFHNQLHPQVRDMHTASGLLDACAVSNLSERQADAQLQEWITRIVPPGERLVLGGSGLQFDHRWMTSKDWWITGDDSPLTYWWHDSGVARRLFKAAGRPWDPGTSAGPSKTHRALDDAQAHMDEWNRAIAELRPA